MSDIKLLPCPFCGGEARYMEIKDFFISRFVTCTKCGIETPRSCLNRKDAIKRWNTRKPMDRIVEQLEEAKDSVPVNRILDDIIKDKPKELGQLMAYENSIEIVKAGGKDDNR